MNCLPDGPICTSFFQTFLPNFFQTVIQMRWHLSVTHQSFLRTHFSLAPSRCGQSELTSGLDLGCENKYLSQGSCLRPGSKPRTDGCPLPYQRKAHLRVAPSQDPQHPEAGIDCILMAAWVPLSTSRCLKPDLSCAYHLCQPIVFLCAAKLQPQD